MKREALYLEVLTDLPTTGIGYLAVLMKVAILGIRAILQSTGNLLPIRKRPRLKRPIAADGQGRWRRPPGAAS